MQEYHYLIPRQQQGQEKNIEHTFLCDDMEEAEDCFVDAKERLLDVNNWNKYSRISDVLFKLTDNRGKEVVRHARKGDHVRINMPAQEAEGHFDWIAIEAIEYDDYPDMSMETFAIRLHPSANPAHKHDDDIAYSLADEATSTFVIMRRGKRLLATYHGRNEPGDAEAGALEWLGLSDEQWASLIGGIAGSGMVKR